MYALLVALTVAATDPVGAADLDALQGTWEGENGYILVIRGNEVTFTSADGYSGYTATLTLIPRMGILAGHGGMEVRRRIFGPDAGPRRTSQPLKRTRTPLWGKSALQDLKVSGHLVLGCVKVASAVFSWTKRKVRCTRVGAGCINARKRYGYGFDLSARRRRPTATPSTATMTTPPGCTRLPFGGTRRSGSRFPGDQVGAGREGNAQWN